MVLPSGFGLPPLPYLLALLAAVGSVGAALRRARPAVTEWTVVALAPWMVVGAALHALYQLGAAPEAARPLLGTPAVYLTTFSVAGAVWLLADRTAAPARTIAGAGVAALLPLLAALVRAGPSLEPGWTIGSVVATALLSGIAWLVLRSAAPDAVRTAGAAGGLVLFAHALDGVTTAVGIDVFGFAERTPASRLILEFAATLPVPDVVGVGWLFVFVKLVVAALVVWVFADYVREEPTRAYLLLALVAAVGMGPGAQNLLLYMVL